MIMSKQNIFNCPLRHNSILKQLKLLYIMDGLTTELFLESFSGLQVIRRPFGQSLHKQPIYFLKDGVRCNL